MSRHRSCARAVALALTAVVLTGLLSAQVSAASRPAPAFTLGLFDGKTLSLADFKGSPVILLFWAPW
jgi:cytochrome c biogenesis protein CcmG, thiol:disulfide interchange protein DsbE